MRMVSPSNPLTTPIQRKRALDHSTLNTSSNPPPSGRPMRKRSAQTLYSPSASGVTPIYGEPGAIAGIAGIETACIIKNEEQLLRKVPRK